MAFDLRGHGLSSKPDQGYTWADHYAEDLVEFLKSYPGSPAILVGHSLGAAVTAPVAANAPECVRAIVMEDPPAFPIMPTIRSDLKLMLILKRLPYDLRVERFMEIMGFSRRLATRRADELESTNAQVLSEILEGEAGYPAEYWFPRVSCPSLVILGSPDKGGVISLDDRPRLERLLKGTRLVEWGDVGHNIHIMRPDRFTAEVKAFLQSLSG